MLIPSSTIRTRVVHEDDLHITFSSYEICTATRAHIQEEIVCISNLANRLSKRMDPTTLPPSKDKE